MWRDFPLLTPYFRETPERLWLQAVSTAIQSWVLPGDMGCRTRRVAQAHPLPYGSRWAFSDLPFFQEVRAPDEPVPGSCFLSFHRLWPATGSAFSVAARRGPDWPKIGIEDASPARVGGSMRRSARSCQERAVGTASLGKLRSRPAASRLGLVGQETRVENPPTGLRAGPDLIAWFD
jgi:hypothetical protein